MKTSTSIQSNNRTIEQSNNFHRGSALLIVLGMMAFMVISAVAFSAWMRASRLPNSYLRRASASRMIAKAAMAEAIDDVDAAIGNNPHPGVGARQSRPKNADATANLRNRNTWMHRIFIGTNDVNNLANQLVETDETVSTLCLEGLAYIPPALVSEARYYSRRSTAGRWHNLDFDCGRYAYCAIDVSDYFDVNAMTANAGRSSAGNSRVTLAHLFENKAHKTYEKDPSAWDDFMKQYARDKSPVEAGLKGGKWLSQSKVPFVSLADLNLAMGEYGSGCGLESPFYKYIQNGASSFYSGDSATSDEGDRYQRMTFVTDALYPPRAGSTADDDYDLADVRYQPFERSLLERSGVAAGTIMDHASQGAVRLREKIARLGLISLYDYLDTDNVPVSLALPQVERTPMIAAMQPRFEGSAVNIVGTKDPSEDVTSPNYPNVVSGGQTTRKVRQSEIYKLDPQKFTQGIMGGKVKAVVAYPFRRGTDIDNPDTFKIDGHVSFFLTTGNFRFRTYEAADCLHLKRQGNEMAAEVACDGVFHAKIPQQQLSFKRNPTTEDEALQEIDLIPQNAANEIANAINQRPILTIVREYEQTAQVNPVTGAKTWQTTGSSIVSAHCGIPALRDNGTASPDFVNDGMLQGWVENDVRQVTVRMAVWLRITNGDGETVDLVPACMMDDLNLRQTQVNNHQSMGPEGGASVGQAYPVMRFDGPTFDFGLTSFSQFNEQAIEFQPKGVMCPDPRWNWAPEHWFRYDSVTKNDWLQKCGRGTDGRDHDIFMATSDAGYMQSVYELAFLPRLTELANDSGSRMGKLRAPDDGRDNWATDVNGVQNYGLMWRTYCPYKRLGFNNNDTGEQWDPFDEVGFVSEGGGVKVNPYSSDTNVVMAVFANTPCDWWAASTNKTDGVSESDRLSAKEFNKKFAFNELSGNSTAKFAWNDLKQIAMNFMQKIGRKRNLDLGGKQDVVETTWQDCWDELDWDGETSEFADVQSWTGQTDELFDVDRKFLYGYWRDCFAPRQQLFLIFVRAEPIMMGGGAIGQTPPQLGARAVALVWRDPLPSSNESTPHRTRILFYRQFE